MGFLKWTNSTNGHALPNSNKFDKGNAMVAIFTAIFIVLTKHYVHCLFYFSLEDTWKIGRLYLFSILQPGMCICLALCAVIIMHCVPLVCLHICNYIRYV